MHPDATGYVKGLYAIQGADAETASHLEGTVKANKYRPFSASNPVERVGDL